MLRVHALVSTGTSATDALETLMLSPDSSMGVISMFSCRALWGMPEPGDPTGVRCTYLEALSHSVEELKENVYALCAVIRENEKEVE